jgi:hypothetical protein
MKLSLESCRLLGYDQTSFSFFPHQCVNYKYKFSSTSSFPLNTATRGFIRSFNYKIIHPLKLNGLCAVEIGSSALICKLRTTTRIRLNKTTRRLTTFGGSNWRRKQRAIQFEFESISISPLLYIPRRDLFHFSEYIHGTIRQRLSRTLIDVVHMMSLVIICAGKMCKIAKPYSIINRCGFHWNPPQSFLPGRVKIHFVIPFLIRFKINSISSY